MNKPLKDINWKSRIDLIEPDFIIDIGHVLRLWADKYRENSRQGVELKHHFWAAMRHLLAFRKWENIDSESWYSHLIHAAANIMFMYHNMNN